jgi:hypothetical protein
MTPGTIQKELANCCVEAVTKTIKEKMSDCLFSVLVNESRDISFKEQKSIVVRFVNQKEEVIERFLGIRHMSKTQHQNH